MRDRGFQERQREQIQSIRRRQEERRQERLLHADQVISRFMEASRLAYGEGMNGLKGVTFNPHTGRYAVCHGRTVKNMHEEALTQAATFLYAKAHEDELKNEG